MSKRTKAESILDSHISKMLNRLPGSYNDLYEMKKLPEYQCTIDAMEEYAEIQCDIIQDLFNKPPEKLRTLEYIIVFDPSQRNCSLMINLNSFIETFSSYEDAKAEAEGWKLNGDCKSYGIYCRCTNGTMNYTQPSRIDG